MQETIDPVSVLVTDAKNELQQRSERLLHLFSLVPDDKRDWSPSSTSRTSSQIVAHCAVVFKFVEDAITGKLPENPPSVEDFLRVMYETENGIAAHENVTSALKDAVVRLREIIGTVTSENIDAQVNTSFGPMPIRFLVTLAQEQLASHIGQIEYLQTIWGDLDNHMG
jgi:hypothetical protein